MTRNLYLAVLLLCATAAHGQETYNKFHHGLPDERIPRFEVKRPVVPVVSVADGELIPLDDEQPSLELQPQAKPYKAPRYEAKLDTPADPFMQWGMGPGPGTPHAAGLNACLISGWPMNEGSGVTLHDTSTGGTNTATVNNISNITWGTHAGYPGSSILWGTSAIAFATSTTLTNFTGTSPFSITVWADGDNGNTVYTSNMANSTSAQVGWVLWHHTVSAGHALLEFRLVNNLSTNAIIVNGSTNFTGGTNYIVVTYDGSQTAAGVKLYLNGALETNSVVQNNLSASAASGLAPAFNAFRDGSLPGGRVMGYGEFYNCALTSTLISTYNAAGPGIY